MDTPILDFVRAYAESGTVRAHMPGHKGRGPLGIEALDLTEIQGADSLYEADGIIRRSEENASRLFGSRMTLYSAEGSSLCIRAMLLTALKEGRKHGLAPVLLAGRNVHRTVLSAACLLDFDIEWLYGPGGSIAGVREKTDEIRTRLNGEFTGPYRINLCVDNVLSILPEAEEIRAALSGMDPKPFAVYLTSPDYLGGMADIGSAAKVCAEFGVPLLVDNAHGAYLRFLSPSLHPLSLGAQMCCDSAHKTLPALTGAAYLHAGGWPGLTVREVRENMALFGSTSPSYLTLASLDGVNGLLAGDWSEKLSRFCLRLTCLKLELFRAGWALYDSDPLRLTLWASESGYRGDELAGILRQKGIECEFADPDFTVLMLSPGQEEDDFRIGRTLLSIPIRKSLEHTPPPVQRGKKACSIRAAMLAPSEAVPTEKALGRILAAPCVSCPPAVPILICGELVTKEAIDAFKYYGIRTLSVVREG